MARPTPNVPAAMTRHAIGALTNQTYSQFGSVDLGERLQETPVQ